MESSWLSLLPPLIVLAVALLSHQLNLSLLTGIIAAALISTSGSPLGSFNLLITRFTDHLTDIDSLYLYGFLISMSCFIVLLNYTGGALACAHLITNRLRSARMAEIATVLLSTTLFIDDYLSTLTTGYVMRPMTDKFKVPRAKLAYLIHSLSAPLLLLVPISTWIAMILSQFELAGISPLMQDATKIIGDPFYVYMQTIPFIFYSALTVFSVWFIVSKRLSFGPMRIHEEIAKTTGSLCGTKKIPSEKLDVTENLKGSAFDLIIPIAILITGSIGGMLYAGGFSWFGGQYSLIQALQNNPSTNLVLLCASGCAFIVAALMAFARRSITFNVIPKACIDGFLIIKSAVIMVILASILGVMLKVDLFTGNYLASTLLGAMNSALLPFMFYTMGVIISVIMGSSWGSIMLLTPIAIPMLLTMSNAVTPVEAASIPLLLPLLGAIFSGSVCGDHVSPISATTMMAATSSGSYADDHAKTQIYYALPAIFSAGLMFLCAGFLAPYGMLLTIFVCLGFGIPLCASLLIYANRRAKAS